MRIALAALMLVVLTGCSFRDEDAFIEDVHDGAASLELEMFTDADFILTGDIACGMMEEGKSYGEGRSRGRSAITGVHFVTVWFPASEHLC